MSTNTSQSGWGRDAVVRQIVVWTSLPLIAIDLLRVMEPFSIDHLLIAIGVSQRWSMIIPLLVYPLIVAAVIELYWPRKASSSEKPEP